MRHGPHAVTQTSGQSLVAYGYDARGNQTLKDATGSAQDRFVHYTSDNRAYEIDAGGALTRFRYGVDGARYLREDGTRRTYYLGNVELVIEHGVRTMKRTVGGVMQQTIVGQAITTHYLFHDHQGSVVAITDAAGVKQKDLDYSAFGTRRDPANPSGSGTGSPVTTRGYTGHEHVDAGGLIHMNARLFDPVLGRFLQPDPMVQDPSGANGWNAYSYVLNNPLRYTDPTGMLGLEERRWAATALIIASYFVAPYATPYLTKFGFAVAVGSAAGGVATASWKGALQGAFSAAVFHGIGSIFEGAQAANSAAIEGGHTLDLVGNSGLTAGQVAAKALSHAMTGGVMAQMQGGKFGHGFISAGVAQLTAPYIDGVGGGGMSSAALRIAVTAVVGGTASALTGGKFANGAITAAFSRAFNAELHPINRYNTTARYKAAVKEIARHRRAIDSKVTGSEDGAAAYFQALAQPISTRYGVEIDAFIEATSGGFRLTGIAVGREFDQNGIGYTTAVFSNPDRLTYIHTHPDNRTDGNWYSPFSSSDMDRARQGQFSAYVSLPNGGLYRFDDGKPIRSVW